MGSRPTSGGSGGGGTGSSSGLGVLRRFIFLPVVVAVGLFGWIANQGTTVADDLVAGDCFIMPAFDEEFERLDTEECSLPHDGQIVASITVPSNASYPDDFDPYWEAVYSQCAEAAEQNMTRIGALPADTELLFVSPVAESWNAGDRGSLCYISAGGGLPGSFISGQP